MGGGGEGNGKGGRIFELVLCVCEPILTSYMIYIYNRSKSLGEVVENPEIGRLGKGRSR